MNRVNQNRWGWTSGVNYDSNEVDWQGTGPTNNARAGDCVTLITNGRTEGKVTNKNTQCTDTKRYCCDPISTASTTTSAPTTTKITSMPTSPSPITTSSATTSYGNQTECGRVRKEWNTLDQSERDLYINGMLGLSNSGKLKKFTEQHGETAAEAQAHGTSAFLTWHRYMVICFFFRWISDLFLYSSITAQFVTKMLINQQTF